MSYRDVRLTRDRMADALTVPVPGQKIDYLPAKFKPPERPDYLADAKRRLLEGAKERRNKPRENAALTAGDWISNPDDYSYLSRDYGY